MLPGKGKQGFQKSGKGSKDGGKNAAGTSGTGKSSKDNSAKTRSKDSSMMEDGGVDDKDNIIVSLPLFKTQDNSRLLPRYTAVLARSEDEIVRIDDLDELQLELESLLSCAASRNRVLREEIKLLESAEEKRYRRSSVLAAAAAAAAASKPAVGKRTSLRTEERPMKKVKESLKTDGGLFTTTKATRVKGPSGGLSELPARDSPKSDTPKVVVHKNDTPNKFWSFVEPYCANITHDDINYLEDLIRTRELEKDSDLHKIPPLGRHYSLTWAEQDLADFKVDIPDQIGGTTGPLTQRLLSALIDEKVAPLQETNDNKPGRELSSHRAASVRNLQGTSFERRVRKELREQGVLDADEAPKEQADDELYLEMKRLESEREALWPHNQQRLKHLLALATAEMHRQELKNKMKTIDNELVNLSNIKQKQRQLTDKEKDQAWRLIKEREILVKQLYVSSNTSG